MTDRFIELLITKVNEYYTCYYEEAPSNATFPYLVMPTLNINPLDHGYLAVFDLEIYNNEISEISIEEIIDNLRDNLDGYFFNEENLAFHLGFDNQLLIKSMEQDLIIRRITMSARIFR